MEPLQIQTERLLLREFTPEDEAAVHAYTSDPDVTLYTSWDPKSREAARATLGQWIAERQQTPRLAITLAIEMRGSGKLAGGAGFISVKNRTGTLGYALDRSYWGRGIAAEATRALVCFGFKRLDLHRIDATCFVENAMSVRILERLGMRREAHFRQSAWKVGRWRDTYTYALLKEEWAITPSESLALS